MATGRTAAHWSSYPGCGPRRHLDAKVEYPLLANWTKKPRHSVSAEITPRAAITTLRVIRLWAAKGKPVSLAVKTSTPDAAQCVHT